MASTQVSRSMAAGTRIGEVDRRLRRSYGLPARLPPPLDNKADPLDELIFIQLTVRTPQASSEVAYRELERTVGGKWERLVSVMDRRALAVLRPIGMGDLKLQRLREQLMLVIAAFGRATLAPLSGVSTGEAERFLLSMPGVGPKVARCVLLYSFHRKVFPVDSNCLRILKRLGVVPAAVDRKAAHNVVQDMIPPRLRFGLHVNLVRHGRAVCTVHRPRCQQCVLQTICQTGRRGTQART